MTLRSLNVGLPRDVVWHGQTVTTGIYKEAVAGRLRLRTLNLDGDRQADLTVHGGAAKAVYCYPSEHYDYWRRELGRDDLPPGMFGENFTTEGFDEATVSIGDEFTVGTAHIVVTQPRMPCYKLGIKFKSDMMVRRFLASGRTGFYVAVIREGDVGAGDVFERIVAERSMVRVSDITRLYVTKRYVAEDIVLAQRAALVPALPEPWKDHFRDRLRP